MSEASDEPRKSARRRFSLRGSMMVADEADGMEIRRRRLRFRCWHRGTREMDLILGRFADRRLAGLGAADLAALEALIEQPDGALYAWISGAEPIPADADSELLQQLIAESGRDES
jgi:antitoxin CptB